MDKEKAIKIAPEYCKNKGLSGEKLSEMYQQEIMGRLFFERPNGVIPRGLENDLDTQYQAVLIIEKDYSVRETEITNIAFAKA